MVSRLSRKEILRMIASGQMTSQEGLKLLAADGAGGQEAAPSDAAAPAGEEPARERDRLREPFRRFLANLIAEETKLAPEAIAPHQPFEKYGIDSVLVVNLNRRLEGLFGDLSKTLFFEYQNLRDLAEYFLEHHLETVRRLLGEDRTPAPAPEPSLPPPGRFLPQQQPGVAGRTRTEQAAPAGQSEQAGPADIAIVGISGRYPGARNLAEFWEVLRQGRDCITEVPADRWDHAAYFDPDKNKPGKTYSKWGGFLDGVDEFDPLFFNISPREAEFMDPQERLFLQTVWHTLEDAGYTRAELSSRTVGVFVGVMYNHYQLYGAEQSMRGNVMALGQSFSSIANRVSYFFDFHGPSLAVDTMCSSSLTAIHLACESIRRGECDMAVAGGVNVTIHPNKYILLAQGKFASSDGRCRSFGEGGDGYVPGEGVGAVLLKPLRQAEADGDTIYAVIKGSALNHGGKTNGYTVPNPVAQSAVIAQAIRQSGVHPRTISYLEAHGTGTSLGDPIEITGLTKAFGQYTQDRQFCAIGSVKSNIGHLESAAGIAALTKVVLQLQHRQLVPSIHSEQLNPNIRFESTPFRVQRELEEWRRPLIAEDGEEREYPRRAGISAFGAGGSNAHLILEEYIAPERTAEEGSTGPALIVLSARSPERLQAYARALADYLADAPADLSLADVAYTLQVGREAMEERLAAVVADLGELGRLLQAWADGAAQLPGRIYRGSVRDGRGRLGDVFEQAEGRSFVADLLRQGKLAPVAEMWVSGVAVDWKVLYAGRTPRRVPLPPYPFAAERYWVPQLDGAAGPMPAALPAAARLHPLLDANESTLDEQCYTKRFALDQPYVADHRVGGRALVPGAVFLEMARAAGELACGGEPVTGLEAVTWEAPLAVAEEPQTVCLSLFPGEERVEFLASSGEEGERVHASGRLLCGGTPELARVDLEAVRGRCPRAVEGAAFYATLRQAGLQYGATYQSVAGVLVGESECLARLELPREAAAPLEGCLLHPALLDGALQAIAPLAAAGREDGIYLPVAVDRLLLAAPLTAPCYARVVRREAREPDTLAFDVLLCDEAGRGLAAVEGLTVRRAAAARGPVPADAAEPLYLTAEWVEAERPAAGSSEMRILLFDRDDRLLAAAPEAGLAPGQVVLVTPGSSFAELAEGRAYTVNPAAPEEYARLLKVLRERGWAPGQIIYRWAEPGDCRDGAVLEAQLATGVHALLYLTQALMGEKPARPVRLVYVVPGGEHGPQPAHAAVSGFARTVRRENPLLQYHTVEFSDSPAPGQAWEMLLAELAAGAETDVRYARGVRQVRQVRERSAAELRQRPLPLKAGGVYLITGGMGGLGLLFARHLAARYGARLALAGRSALTAHGEKALAELRQLGGEAVYLQADVASQEEARRLVRQVSERLGPIDGVLHSAGVLRDSFLLKKQKAEMDAVLAPKVQGTLALAEALGGHRLDFFVLFSSTAALFGNVGQCDYAYANSFMDHFALALPADGPLGRVLSVNWPLWAEGGMRIGDEAVRLLEEAAGIRPLETAAGMRALETALMAGAPQVAVLAGDKDRIRRALGLGGPAGEAAAEAALASTASAPPATTAPAPATPAGGDPVESQTEAMLRAIFARALKLPESRISMTDSFERYGIDSIMIMELTRQLEERFGELPKTLFFQYPTLSELKGYFLNQHREKLEQLFGRREAAAPAGDAAAPAGSAASLPGAREARGAAVRAARGWRSRRQRLQQLSAPRPLQQQGVAVAIIGLAGRYPQADTLDQFWENLRSGRDCITEIPAERWDASAYYDPDKGVRGKSYGKWGGFIDGFDRFDPLFFNISPLEAEFMDPQERLFLQTVWHAMEDAGYVRERLSGRKVGVFVGVMYGQYQLYAAEESARGNVMALGSSYASIANRVSYFLNLRGPSMAVDTMCSSSLTAIHLACESLARGECEMAFAGGVNLTVHPNKYILLSQGKFLSSDGRCRAFGEGGDGYVPGEGVGAVLLKPLDRAVADGDQIYGVIRATVVNHGGKVTGYTVPNPNAQADLIAEALRKAGIAPGDVTYVEAHGTGTALGDPIEIAGLSAAFGDIGGRRCPIGSVKSNIGHLESAAGIASLTKVLLQIKHRQLVPSLHADRLNPHIDFDKTPFYVQRELTEWAQPRRAAISSFGAGGSNAHLIVEEYQAAEQPVRTAPPYLIPLSARNAERLKAYAQSLLACLQSRTVPPHPAGGVSPALQPVPADEIRRSLAAILSEILGAQVDPSDDISTHHLDLLQLAKIAEEMNRRYDADVRPTAFAGCDSLEQMAAAFLRECGAALSGLPASAEPVPEEVDLARLSYTLQTGREPMEERLVLLVESLADLREKLARFCRGEAGVEGVVTGNVRRDREKAELLLGAAHTASFVAGLVRSRDLLHLGRLWAAGVEIDWSLLWEGARPRPVSLPGYPFAPERYWPQLTKTAAPFAPAPLETVAATEQAAARTGLLLVKRWRPEPAPAAATRSLAGTALVVVNEETAEIGARLFEGAAGLRTLVVPRADLADAAAGAAAAARVSAATGDLIGVIDLSDLYMRPLERNQPFTGKIGLIQGLLRDRVRDAFFIVHVTRGLQPFEAELPTLAGAGFAGLVRMLGAEYRQLHACTVDIDDIAVLPEILGAELALGKGEPEVCYRRGVRYVPYLERQAAVDLGAETGRLPVSSAGVVVITGGTRGIGAEVARHLVRRGARKLVLMGLQPLPDRESWEALLADDAGDPALRERVRLVQELEQAGARVELYAGPLTDRERMAGFFAQVKAGLGPVTGVIHCAGVSLTDNPAFIHKRPEQIARTLEPKVDGLETLHEVLAGEPLEYFVLFSSISALSPALAVGVSDYAAANAFMDAFAAYQHSRGRTWYRSLAWPNWKEVGMGETRSPVYTGLGLEALTTAEGLALLEAAMAAPGGALLVPLVVDPGRFAPERLLAGPRADSAEALQGAVPAGSAGAAGWGGGPAGSAGAAPWLRQLFAEELRIPLDQLDDDTPFGDYGVDSILLAELVRTLERRVGRKIDPAALLENPTLRQLSQYLADLPGEAAEVMTAGEAAAPAPAQAPAMASEQPHAAAPVPASTVAPASVPATAPSVRKVAVIGLACHFPGARNKEEFWENLRHGRSAIAEVPPSRWDVQAIYSPTHEEGKSVSKWGGFIDGIEEFDPAYFGIGEEEAPHTDPLLRQFLEVCAETINDAGYGQKELWGKRVGVFVGARAGAYAQKVRRVNKYSILGLGQNFIAARVSHWLNLKGPSMVVDTACSSSLVAVHLACQSILSGESEMAIAGGVDLLLDEKPYVMLSEGGALSPDGRCHTFDEKANGFVPGEGCGAVLLKPLDRALADGDQIYAVIEASAVNNDGHTMGVTTPNPDAQAEVIERALRTGGIDPGSISYVETHGTGTMIGDPIELKALTRVFRAATDERQFCRVGSVKTNIGHLLSAAGVASLIKVLLSIRHRQLPPTLNCEVPNPRFRFEESPFLPCTALVEWAPRRGVRRAGISSFGFGGTNAHMIVSELDGALAARYAPRRRPLPPIVYNRRRYWVEEPAAPALLEIAEEPDQPDSGPVPLLAITEERDENV